MARLGLIIIIIMKRTKEEQEKAQLEILKFLFKLGTPTRLEEPARSIKQSESGTHYYWLQDSYHIIKD
jgi:hypothetical protein